MAGHSKWANIQHRKKAQDAKRGKLFTKLIREITVAAKMGGGEVDSNPRLRLAIDKGLAGNMTRDTIERAIKKGTGDLDADNVEEITYEGYGPNGIAVMVMCLTDNRNRTVAEVRHAFTKSGGNLGTDGSVAYLFTKSGLMSFAPDSDSDSIMDEAIDAGAEDIVVNDDDSVDVFTTVEDYMSVKKILEEKGFKPDNADIVMLPSTEIEADEELAEKIVALVERLEDLDDVQNVYTNADLSVLS